jgi:glycosyltransferase involved in cell wall biosynthesis
MQKRYPKITVVTQCFNREAVIAETIESVLSQGYPNLEYIVLDDNSTDGSWEVIERYRDRLALCERRTEESTTPVPTINYGFSRSSGEIMIWLNAKNVLMPKALFAVASIFGRFPEIEWLTGIGLTIDGDGKVISVVPYRKDLYAYLSGQYGHMQQESTFFRRSLWERAGSELDPAYPNAFDVGLWAKFFPLARLYFANTVFGAYRKSSKAMSAARRAEFEQYNAEALRTLRKRVPKSELVYAGLYRVLRLGTPVMQLIPDDLFARLPVLRRLRQRCVRFATLEDDRGVPVLYERNPFRTIYPW